MWYILRKDKKKSVQLFWKKGGGVRPKFNFFKNFFGLFLKASLKAPIPLYTSLLPMIPCKTRRGVDRDKLGPLSNCEENMSIV